MAYSSQGNGSGIFHSKYHFKKRSKNISPVLFALLVLSSFKYSLS